MDDEIRGEIGYLAGQFHLSDEATRAFYDLFVDQAKRWEQQVRFCRVRIRNQRSEILRLERQRLTDVQSTPSP